MYAKYKKKKNTEFLLWLTGLGFRLVSMRMCVQSLASLSRLKIQCWHKLLCRSQMQRQLRSGIAVAVAKASSCSSD